MPTNPTAEPWGIFPDEWTEGKTRVLAGGPDEPGKFRRIIAYLGDENDDATDPERDANERLLLAAPRLLALCIRALEIVQRESERRPGDRELPRLQNEIRDTLHTITHGE